MAFVWLFVYRYTPFMVRWVDSRYQGLVPSSDVLNQLHGDAVVPSCRRLAFRLQYSARVQSRHMEWYFRPCHSLYVVLFCGDTSAFIVCNGVLSGSVSEQYAILFRCVLYVLPVSQACRCFPFLHSVGYENVKQYFEVCCK